MDVEQQFILGGAERRVTRRRFEERLADVAPETSGVSFVVVGDRRYPLRQAVAVGLGLPREALSTQAAFRVLLRLGFAPGELVARRPPVVPARPRPSPR